MNERLEQEIDKWFGITQRDAAGKPVQEVSDWKESPDVMMCMNVASIRGFAKHFYNLALADVRKKTLEIGASSVQHPSIELVQFIDNLIK